MRRPIHPPISAATSVPMIAPAAMLICVYSLAFGVLLRQRDRPLWRPLQRAPRAQQCNAGEARAENQAAHASTAITLVERAGLLGTAQVSHDGIHKSQKRGHNSEHRQHAADDIYDEPKVAERPFA